MKYIQGTVGLPLILSMEKYGDIKWYDYAEISLHNDTRSHTGGFMTIGKFGGYVQSSKKN